MIPRMELSQLIEALQAVQAATSDAAPKISREQKLQAVMEHLVDTGTFTMNDDGKVVYEAQAEVQQEAEAEAEQPEPEAPAANDDVAETLRLILGANPGSGTAAESKPGDIEDDSLGGDDLVSAYESMLKAEVS